MVLDSERWRIHSYFPGPCSEWCSFCRVIFGRNPVAKDCIYPNIIKPGEKFHIFFLIKLKERGEEAHCLSGETAESYNGD